MWNIYLNIVICETIKEMKYLENRKLFSRKHIILVIYREDNKQKFIYFDLWVTGDWRYSRQADESSVVQNLNQECNAN